MVLPQVIRRRNKGRSSLRPAPPGRPNHWASSSIGKIFLPEIRPIDHADEVSAELMDDPGNPSPGNFTPTRWSLIRGARQGSKEALNELCEKYRSSILRWLRGRGHSVADAEDLVQGFFVALLRRDFLQDVNPEKGRFRSFLLKSLNRYLADVHDFNSALKRGGGLAPVSLQEVNETGQMKYDPASTTASPDREFDINWARTVLASALDRLRAECAQTKHTALCAALEPVLYADETALPYSEVAAQLGMREEAVRVAAFRIRARFRRILRDEVLQTVDSEEDLKSELDYLADLFGK